MCTAFSGIIDFNDKVTWKLGVDSHSDLAKLGGYADKQLGEFAKFEITPRNNNYLNPDEWIFQWDEDTVPDWCGSKQKELALQAHKKWLKQLDKILVRKMIVNPFDLTPPKIGPRQIRLLKNWNAARVLVQDSVRKTVFFSVGVTIQGSVWSAVWIPVGVTIRNSIQYSVQNLIRASTQSSTWNSVANAIYGYIGSFYKIPVWKFVKHPKGKYPFQPVITLWNQGLVPSFDGITWRLHGGPKAEVLFSITRTDLEKYE